MRAAGVWSKRGCAKGRRAGRERKQCRRGARLPHAVRAVLGLRQLPGVPEQLGKHHAVGLGEGEAHLGVRGEGEGKHHAVGLGEGEAHLHTGRWVRACVRACVAWCVGWQAGPPPPRAAAHPGSGDAEQGGAHGGIPLEASHGSLAPVAGHLQQSGLVGRVGVMGAVGSPLSSARHTLPPLTEPSMRTCATPPSARCCSASSTAVWWANTSSLCPAW